MHQAISEIQAGISEIQAGISENQAGISENQAGISEIQVGISEIQAWGGNGWLTTDKALRQQLNGLLAWRDEKSHCR